MIDETHDSERGAAQVGRADLSAAQRTVLMSGLTAASIDPRGSATVDERELGELVGWAAQERLDGLLWNALMSGELVVGGEHDADGAPRGVDDDVQRDGRSYALARETHLTNLKASLAAEATAAVSITALRGAGIDAFLFKGLANAHLDYADPALRNFFDADLLVRRADLAEAIETLLAVGFTRAAPPLRKRWEHRFARAVELRSPEGVELDLHAALATGYFGEILDHDALRVEPESVGLGPAQCAAFGPAARLLISCYAIVLSRGPGLRLYRDLAQQLIGTEADWRAAARLAGDGDAVIAEALLRLNRRFGVDHEAVEWARGISPSPTARKALSYARAAEQQGWSADARSTMLALTPAERVRFVAGIIAPSRSSLDARRRTLVSHVTRSRGSTRALE